MPLVDDKVCTSGDAALAAGLVMLGDLMRYSAGSPINGDARTVTARTGLYPLKTARYVFKCAARFSSHAAIAELGCFTRRGQLPPGIHQVCSGVSSWHEPRLYSDWLHSRVGVRIGHQSEVANIMGQ